LEEDYSLLKNHGSTPAGGNTVQTLSEPCNLQSNWRVNMFTSGQAQEVSFFVVVDV